MTRVPFRSHGTALTDDELLLLDFLFDGGAAMGLLRSSVYGLNMNTTYTHAIAGRDLPQVLNSLVDRDIVDVTPDDRHPSTCVYRLTTRGGAMWSSERMPVWDRYCTSLLGGDNLAVQEVLCVNLAVGTDYLRVGYETGRIRTTDDINQLQWERINPSDLIYWRPTEVAWRTRVAVKSEGTFFWDRWGDLNARRTWWDSLDELQAFLPR